MVENDKGNFLMGASKTNAMRILDNKRIEYGMMSYDARDGKIDGITVADKIGNCLLYTSPSPRDS